MIDPLKAFDLMRRSADGLQSVVRRRLCGGSTPQAGSAPHATGAAPASAPSPGRCRSTGLPMTPTAARRPITFAHRPLVRAQRECLW